VTITEFHQLSVAALAAEPDEETLIDLAKEAQQLADMVGWADGIIDKEGYRSKRSKNIRPLTTKMSRFYMMQLEN